MGGKSSKHKGGGDASVTPNLIDLTLYEAACKADPSIATFDTALHERTNRVINTLAADVQRQSLSFDSLRELTNGQLELNQQVLRMILDCQRDIWEDKDLFDLVDDYFKTSDHTLSFCNALDNCLARARNSHLILQITVRHFEEEEKEEEEEKGDEVGPEGIRFAKTLIELEKFKATGDPFGDEFFGLLKSVSERQLGLLKRLLDRKKKVDLKLKSSRRWSRVSNVLFVAALVSALIFSVVAAAVAAPPVVTALAGVLTIPIGSVGKWVNSLWKKYQKELKRQKQLLGLMGGATRISILEVENMGVLVGKFKNDIESLMQNAELANLGDEGVRLAVGEIKGKIEGFITTIDVLLEQSHRCSQEIRMMRTILSQKLVSNSNDN